jgi:enterochelin esterase-like enzyme
VVVYLPYNYNQVFFTRFPVLYLLHGFAGTPEDWLINAKIADVVEKLIADGKIPPLIIVMPDANGPVIKDSEYIDATLVNQPMESYIIKEIIPFIDDKYRTITDPQGRAVAGVSSGAFAAVNLTLRHPDVFHDAISLGGYFINREWPTDKLVGSDTPERRANEPLKYIDSYSTDENLHLYLAYSEIDFKDFIADNLQMDQKLTAKSIDHVLVKMPGVHFWTAWNKQLPDALTWLGGHFRDEL